MMEESRRPRLRFRLGTLLLVVAILALLLVVVIQQVQISRQQVQIRQMRQEIDRYLISQDKLTEIIRALRDHLDRAGSSSGERHR
jgi:cytochrome c-type biogenesis protein CcmH/NrfG